MKNQLTMPETKFVNKEENGVNAVIADRKIPICFNGAHREQITPMPAKFAEYAIP